MKTSVDIPEKDLREVIRNTGASTKREAIMIAVRTFNRQKRLEDLSQRLYGSMPKFMAQQELKLMREDNAAKK